MAALTPPPFYEKFSATGWDTFKTAAELAVFLLLLLHIFYRALHLGDNGGTWAIAFLCEIWFSFIWFMSINIKWRPVRYTTYPERLLQEVGELPRVDMFVTTADSELEPPIMTVDTVLSLMAAEYPAEKLTCYVSDDGASPVTYYSLLQASEFAKSWVPFCKRHHIQTRAPSVFFSEFRHGSPSELSGEWAEMKEKYDALRRRVQDATEMTTVSAMFNGFERNNHPSVVKVIWGSTENTHVTPQLVYVSREKKPKCFHNYKAGAMNVLTRVSGVMTNAPFILNVDCDMFMNNPNTILHAMCLLLGCPVEREHAFVQFPQCFHGVLKDDPFGNQYVVLQEFLGPGLGGIQGSFYLGTGCFHRRKIIYGEHPQYGNAKKITNGTLYNDFLKRKFGDSLKLVEATSYILCGSLLERTKTKTSLEAAIEVASCTFERNTCWGDEVGWVYGSSAEDMLTGLKIHSMGWRSVHLALDPPAFVGYAPSDGPICMIQQKRWATGLFDVAFHKRGPLLATLTKNLQLRQCLGYLMFLLWAPRSIPELVYSLVPAYCLITGKTFLPKVTDVGFVIPAGVFVFYNIFTLAEYRACGQSVRSWWNNQRMSRITSVTAWLFAVLSVLFKRMGFGETMFELTRKEHSSSRSEANSYAAGSFTFDSSSFFVPGTALVILHMAGLVVAFYGAVVAGSIPGLGEILCSTWLLLCFLPFVKGLFLRGRYGIPWGTLIRASSLALLFVSFCWPRSVL